MAVAGDTATEISATTTKEWRQLQWQQQIAAAANVAAVSRRSGQQQLQMAATTEGGSYVWQQPHAARPGNIQLKVATCAQSSSRRLRPPQGTLN